MSQQGTSSLKQSRSAWQGGDAGSHLPCSVSQCIGKAWLFVGFVIVLGVVLRGAALFNNLWLDEIWSLNIAGMAGSPVDIFFRLTHDNNHPLNTLFLWILGEQSHEELYRLLSFGAGVGSLLVLGMVARRPCSRATLVMTLVLASTSFLMVNYSSEARGYGLAVFFALLSLQLAPKAHEGGGGWCVLLGLTMCFGMASHMTYLFVYAGICVWTMVSQMQAREHWGQRIRGFLRLHAIPLSVAGIYIFIWRDATIGGGPQYDISMVLLELLRQVFGLPSGWLWTIAVALTVVAVAGTEIRRCFPHRQQEGWFFLTVLVLAPVFAIILVREDHLFPRYFVVCLPFVLILLGRFLGRWMDLGGWRRILALTMVVLYCAGNAGQISLLIRHGRGEYQAALRFISSQANTREVTVGGEQDLQIGTVVNYYAPHLGLSHAICYIPQAGITGKEPPEWFITEMWDGVLQWEFLRLENGAIYRFSRAFPALEETVQYQNHQWFIYHRVNATEAGAEN